MSQELAYLAVCAMVRQVDNITLPFTMPTSLETLIHQEIQNQGPLSVARLMELALLHPEHGYYTTATPFGREGDFITAPQISQIFGEMVGLWAASKWQTHHLSSRPRHAAGQEREHQIVELGPGRGTLMHDALRATTQIEGFHDHIDIHLVEASEALQAVQSETLSGSHPNIHWHTSIGTLPERPALIIANEFFDALPIRQFEFQSGAWHERCVRIDDGQLIWMHQPAATEPEHVHYPPPIIGDILEQCEAAITIMQTLVEHIKTHGGAMLIIDYGYAKPAFGDTLQAVKNHQYHNVLADIGRADITAHVNFTALADIAKQAGLNAHLNTQGDFLREMGAQIRAEQLCKNATASQVEAIQSGLTRLTDPNQMGSLFKVLVIQ